MSGMQMPRERDAFSQCFPLGFPRPLIVCRPGKRYNNNSRQSKGALSLLKFKCIAQSRLGIQCTRTVQTVTVNKDR